MGMGWKKWTRERLTSAQLQGYLQDQVVATFLSGSQRDAIMSTPAEGMICYLADAKTFARYNGSAWQPLVASEMGYSLRTTQAGPVVAGVGAVVVDGSQVTVTVPKTSVVRVDLSGAVTSNVAGTLVGYGIKNLTSGGAKVVTTPIQTANVGHGASMYVRSVLPAGTYTFAVVLQHFGGSGGAYTTADAMELEVLLTSPGL